MRGVEVIAVRARDVAEGATCCDECHGAVRFGTMSRKGRTGVCKLTGTSGPYVASHIIPRALTLLSRTGEKYIETGIGLGVKKRSNSWYDYSLVTKHGEDILATIDSGGIEQLRLHRLVWSGWGLDQRLQSDDIVGEDSHQQFRLIPVAQPKVLQIFFLSLLWRAAATTRPEFKDVCVPESVLEDLTKRVSSKDPGRAEDYPIQLFQIITRGITHNRTPLLEWKHALNMDLAEGPEILYVRFYFDGLVAHVHLALGQTLPAEYLNTCLGFKEKTIVFLHEFESSRTSADIMKMAVAVQREQTTIQMPLNPIVAGIYARWPPPDR
jgi:hypothetical protein